MRAGFNAGFVWRTVAVGFIATVVAAFWMSGQSKKLVPTAKFSVEELCKDDFASDWRIKHQPDLPGPYTERVPGFFYYHPGKDAEASSTVRLCEKSGAVVWEERTRPGVEFQTLVLKTSDGQLAHGLLVRGE